MANVNVKLTRDLSSAEMQEVMQLVKIQESNDRYENTKLSIDGNYAKIDVVIDELGDITVL